MTPKDSYISQVNAILSTRDSIRRHLSSSSSILPYLSAPLADAHLFYSVDQSKSNSSANRYPLDIFAYDRTSVKVRWEKGEEGYLNANVVKGEGERWWVASQAPIPGTIYTFLLAIITQSAKSTYESLYGPSSTATTSTSTSTSHSHSAAPATRAAIVVQLTDFIEQGRRKADVYLPPSERSTLQYDPPPTLPFYPSIQIEYISSERDQSLSSWISKFRLRLLSRGKRKEGQTEEEEEEEEDGSSKQIKSQNARKVICKEWQIDDPSKAFSKAVWPVHESTGFLTNLAKLAKLSGMKRRQEAWDALEKCRLKRIGNKDCVITDLERRDIVAALEMLESSGPSSATSMPPTATVTPQQSDKSLKCPSRQTDREMELYHYHFEGWPDHGVPEGEDVSALKRLVEEVERKREELEVVSGKKVEVWVHCSAGIGRTGTFIALSALLHPPPTPPPPRPKAPTSMLIPLLPQLQRDKVARIVDLLREQRGMMVQTKEQLELIYEVVDGEGGGR